MYLIVEEQDVGGPRDSIVRLLLATESVYGGEILPAFTNKLGAVQYIAERSDSYRKFKIIPMTIQVGAK